MIVTAAFTPGRAVDDLVFLPNEQAPWQGLIAASLADGGYDIYDLDGEIILAAGGPRLHSIAAAPSFALRGMNFPLLFGVDSQGAVRAQALLRDAGEMIEIGLGEDTLAGGASAVCRFNVGIGYIDIAVLGSAPTAQIWRIQDIGEDDLSATLQTEFDLPFPARACASTGTELIVAGPNSGIARLTSEGEVAARAPGFTATDIVYAELLGRPAVLTPATDRGRVRVFDAGTLEPITELDFEGGLNAAALERPDAFDMTDANFGGSPFAAGLMAVYDRADGSIKLVGREVVTRAVVAPPEL